VGHACRGPADKGLEDRNVRRAHVAINSPHPARTANIFPHPITTLPRWGLVEGQGGTRSHRTPIPRAILGAVRPGMCNWSGACPVASTASARTDHPITGASDFSRHRPAMGGENTRAAPYSSTRYSVLSERPDTATSRQKRARWSQDRRWRGFVGASGWVITPPESRSW